MAKEKRIMCYRQVVHMQEWGGESRTGNPRNYRFLLECGHVQFEYYARGWAIKLMAWEVSHEPNFKGTPMKMRRHCVRCKLGRPITIAEIITGDLHYLSPEKKKEVMDLLTKPEGK